MTIGPEPRTRILCRSSRLGTGVTSAGRPDRGLMVGPDIVSGYLADELIEEAELVVRTRSGLGVILDAAGRDVEQANALDRSVIQVHVRELRLAQVASQALAGFALHREAVVLRSDR